jgi:hypothetical protein
LSPVSVFGGRFVLLWRIKNRPTRLFYALLVTTVGERPLGIQASQLNAIARWSRIAAWERGRPCGRSRAAVQPDCPGCCRIGAKRGSTGVELYGSYASLKEIIRNEWTFDQKPEMFCFGLLEAFDMKQLEALAGPKKS